MHEQLGEAGLRDLFFVEVHAVPVMSQRGHLSLPVLQEGNGPEGHEDTEEDGARVVKQVAQLPHTQHIPF